MANKKAIGVLKSLYFALVELVYYGFLVIPIMYYSGSFVVSLCWLVLLVLAYSSYSVFLYQRKPSYWLVSLLVLIHTGVTSAIVYYLMTSVADSYNIVIFLLIATFSLWFSISGYRQSKHGFTESFSVTFMGLTILCHLVLQLLKITWLVELTSINLLLYGVGILAILLTLFISNERMLAEQQKLLGKSSVQQHALKMNRILISILSGITIVIIVFREWQTAIEDMLRRMLNWFLSLFNGEQEQALEEEIQAQEPVSFPFMQEEQKEPSAFLMFLEKLFVILAYTILVIAVIAILVLLFRLFSRLIKKLIFFMNGRTNIGIEDNAIFIDEVEEIEKTSRNKQVKGRSLFNKKIVWRTLTTEQKCYQLYILLNHSVEKQGHQYIKHFTVQEQIAHITSQYEVELSADELILLEKLYDYAKFSEDRSKLIELDVSMLDQLYVKLNDRK